ncbi:MAG: gliding motility-associated C-terminal domain-containing protein [Chitinophagaceae bacterium]|nr:gliding motility-associated C-terminal domain-containing protein [Chitinophagaceae bacterium]
MPRTPSPILTLIVLLFVSVSLKAQVLVTATAGTIPGPTTYTTLKGAFDAVNAGTHQGNISIQIQGNTTETATAALNASGSGAASYSFVGIRPASGASPVISGNISSGPVIKLNGSSYVTIDGSNNGSNSRDLTITNTSGISSNVLVIGSVSTTPINYVTVKNALIINGTNTSTAVVVGDGSMVGSPGYFSNISFLNNDIRKAYIGIYFLAAVVGGNSNILVEDNDLDASGADAIRMVGIYAQTVNGIIIRNNNIGNFETSSTEFDRGIWLASGTINATASGNQIYGLNYSGTAANAPFGISISTTVANSNILLEGNNIHDLSSNGTGTTMGVYAFSAMSDVTIRKNKISNISNSNTGGYGAAGIVLVPNINTAAIKVQNNFIWDIKAYGFNGYTSADNANGIVIDGGGGFDIDHNTVSLNANPTLTGSHRSSCFLITANVTAAGTVNLRNNIFSNTQTVGNASSRLAISNLATSGAGVFSAIDNNVYFSSSTNLSSTGTNASITNTIAQLQTSLGGNANSLNVQPDFVSFTDLHLDKGSNTQINGKGSPIGSITTDIDGEVRDAATPDPGADEFTPCLPITINTQPVPKTICPGNIINFSVAATNATTWKWQLDDGSGFTDLTNVVPYNNVNTSTMTVNVPAMANGFTYRCAITSGPGCPVVYSDPAVLTVPSAPASVSVSGDITISHGGNATFTATPNGGIGPFTYQWQEGYGGVFADVGGAPLYSGGLTPTLTITGATTAMNGAQYRCVVRSCGTVRSDIATLTVNKLPQTLSFTSQTSGGIKNVTYGDAGFSGVATASFGLTVTYVSGNIAVASVDAVGVVTVVGAGTTTITASQGGDAIYLPAPDISFTVVVNPKNITVSAAAKSKIYGDSDPSLTYTANPALIGSDVFTGSMDRDPGENVGNYQVLQNTLTAGPNYNIAFNSNVLHITPRTLVVTADDKTRQYGFANPPLTFSYSGFAFTDNASVLSPAPVASTSAVTTSWPGDYPITIAGGSSGNYTFSYVPGKLTIEAILLNVTKQPANSRICADARATFSTAITVTPSIAPVDYQWQYSADGFINWTDLPQGKSASYVTKNNSATGFYRCKLSVPGTDFFTQAAELTLYPLPTIVAVKSNDIDCAFSSAKLAATGGVSYQWSPAYALTNPAIPNPVASPDRTTTYLVTGTDGNGCTGTDRITVTYTPSEYNVPNAFTPNNDGKNDVFGVRHWQKISDFSLSIFNRYGARIFYSTDLSKGWDGTVNGIAQGTGSYVYYIKGVAPCGVIERKGSLMLIR